MYLEKSGPQNEQTRGAYLEFVIFSRLWLSVVDVLFGQDGLSAIFGRSSADGAKRLRCGGFNHAMVRVNFEREQTKV